MKQRLLILVGLVVVLVFGLQVSAQGDDLPQTFASSSDVFSISYPATWDAYEVGPAIFWIVSPGTGQVWEPLPAGGARISISLPAQIQLLGNHYDTSRFQPIEVAGQTGYLLRGNNGSVNTITVVLEFPDGQLAAVLNVNPADQELYEPVFLAMVDTIQYQPGESPTPTPLPTTESSVAQDDTLSKTYYSPYFHLLFRYPADWFIEERPGGVQLLNYEYDNSGPNAPGEARVQFVSATILSQVLSLDTSDPVAFLDTLRLVFNSGDNIQGEAAAITLGDRPFARADGVFLGSKTLYLAVGSGADEMLFISGEASDADFATFEPLFLQIAATSLYKQPSFANPLPSITPDNAADISRYFEFNTSRLSGGQTEQVVFSPDGTLAANVLGRNGVQIWDTTSGDLLDNFDNLPANQVAFSPDSRRMVAVDFQAGLQIVDLDRAEVSVFPSEDSLRAVAYCPDGTLIATGGSNGTVRLWSAETLEVGETLAQLDVAIADVKFSPNGSLLAATGRAGMVSLWHMDANREHTELALWEDTAGTVVALGFSQDGSRLAALAVSGAYAVVDTANSEVILTGKLDESVFYKGLALNHDGSLLAVILQEEGTIALLNASNGRMRARLSQGGDAVGSIAFSPDGTRLLAGGFYRNTFVLWAVGLD